MAFNIRNIKIRRLIILFLAWLVLPIWINFGTANVSKWYEGLETHYFAKNQFAIPILWFLIAIFLFLAAVIANTSSAANASDEATDERQKLLKDLQERYDQRLKNKMDKEEGFRMKVRLTYTKEGTTDLYYSEHYKKEFPIGSVQEFEELFQTFENKIKRLLILGEPGSGKTVLLLQFACHYIENAINDPKYPMPVLVNMASWRKSFPDFESWLEETLTYTGGGVGASRKFAKELIAKDNLFLMLDGLDEVPEADRPSCLEHLHQYLKVSQRKKDRSLDLPHAVICSRLNEYIDLEEDAYVRASLRITPFNPDALKKKLESMEGDPPDLLLMRLKAYPDLADKLTTAFNIHLALRIVEDKTAHEFATADMLLEFCVAEMKRLKNYSLKKQYRYLHFLSFILSKTKKVVTFELTDLQPFWATESTLNKGYGFYRTNRFNKRWYYFLVLEGLRSLIILAVFMALAFLIAFNEHTEWKDMWIPPFAALACAIIVGLFFGLTNRIYGRYEINVKESRHFNPKDFSWRTFAGSFKKSAAKIFIPIMIGVLIGGIIGAINDSHFGNIEGGLWEGLKRAAGYAWDYKFQDVEGNALPSWIKYFSVTLILLSVATYIYLNRDEHSAYYQKITAPKKRKLVLYIDMLLAIAWLTFWINGIKGFIVGLLYGFYQGPFDKPLWDFGVTFFAGLILGTPLSTLFGIYSGLINSLFTAKRTVLVYKPYRRFLNALFFDYLRFSSPFTFLFVAIAALVIVNDRQATVNFGSLMLGFALLQIGALFLAFYNSALIKHLAVRWLLFLQGKAPFRYRRFLDKIATTGLMEKDGGEWRFRHQLIQNLFEEL